MTKLGGAVAVGLVAVLMTAGCTPETPAGEAPAVEESPPEPEVSSDTVVAEISVGTGAGTATVRVHPIVRDGDLAVLTLDVDPDDADPDKRPLDELETAWSSRSRLNLTRWIGVRLLDLDDDLVMVPGLGAEGETIELEQETESSGDTQRLQLAYEVASDTEQVTLLLPQAGVVPGVPIIDGDVPEVGEQGALDVSAVIEADAVSMFEYTVDTATTTRTSGDRYSTRITLGSDVLFAYDSAELSGRAHDVIAEAAEAIMLREPGEVSVVGHTDSEGTDAYNQTLSEQRAEAVAAELRTLIDEGDYPLTASGRGESEPVASNGSEDGRALNRRVELGIMTPEREDAETEVVVEVPDIEGPVATGAEGVLLDTSRPYRVTIPRAYAVDGHLVVEVRTEALDDAVGSAFGPALFEGSFPEPPGLETLRSMAGLAVMNGSVGTLPVMHRPAQSDEEHLIPLTDLATFARLDGGQSRTSVIVYPEMAVGDTITVDLLGVYVPGWRLTDIPVEER